MELKFYKSIRTFFGLGYISPFPGTLASLVTIFIIWLIQNEFGIQITIICLIFLTLIASIAIENDSDKRNDPKEIVIDEVIGQSLVLIFLPLTYKDYILGFIFFRFFDIYKPFPIKFFEQKYQNSFGIIFDDIIAAVYALLTIYIINIIF